MAKTRIAVLELLTGTEFTKNLKTTTKMANFFCCFSAVTKAHARGLEAKIFQPSKKFHATLYLAASLVRRRNEQKSFTTTLVCQECFLAAASLRRSWRERKYGSARSTSPPHHLSSENLKFSCAVQLYGQVLSLSKRNFLRCHAMQFALPSWLPYGISPILMR